MISVSLAVITYRLIEVPALRHKSRATSTPKPVPATPAEQVQG